MKVLFKACILMPLCICYSNLPDLDDTPFDQSCALTPSVYTLNQKAKHKVDAAPRWSAAIDHASMGSSNFCGNSEATDIA